MGVSAFGAAIIGEKTGAFAPKAPKAPPPVLMPDQDALNAARKKSIAEQQMRTGRASTILSSASDAGISDKLGP